jgi:hypothetical protein
MLPPPPASSFRKHADIVTLQTLDATSGQQIAAYRAQQPFPVVLDEVGPCHLDSCLACVTLLHLERKFCTLQ